jgi:hypothetical protein
MKQSENSEDTGMMNLLSKMKIPGFELYPKKQSSSLSSQTANTIFGIWKL